MLHYVSNMLAFAASHWLLLVLLAVAYCLVWVAVVAVIFVQSIRDQRRPFEVTWCRPTYRPCYRLYSPEEYQAAVERDAWSHMCGEPYQRQELS